MMQYKIVKLVLIRFVLSSTCVNDLYWHPQRPKHHEPPEPLRPYLAALLLTPDSESSSELETLRSMQK
jgi:hypothetical protein